MPHANSAVPQLTFIVSANNRVGYGHLMRCLTLARHARTFSIFAPRFLLPADSDAEPVRRAGFPVISTATEGVSIDPALRLDPKDGPLVIDSYSVTEDNLLALERAGLVVTLFDDGCRLGRYSCDAVIDSAPHASSLPYVGAPRTRLLLGTQYFPLRPEFSERIVGGPVARQHLLVTFGGGDEDDRSAAVFDIIRTLGVDFPVTIVLGPGYRGRLLGTTLPEDGHIRSPQDPDDLAELMASARLAISGAGGTALELAAMGVPSVLLTLSADQRPLTEALVSRGAGRAATSAADAVAAAIELYEDDKTLDEMSAAVAGLIDGRGAERIVSAINVIWSRRRIGVRT